MTARGKVEATPRGAEVILKPSAVSAAQPGSIGWQRGNGWPKNWCKSVQFASHSLFVFPSSQLKDLLWSGVRFRPVLGSTRKPRASNPNFLPRNTRNTRTKPTKFQPRTDTNGRESEAAWHANFPPSATFVRHPPSLTFHPRCSTLLPANENRGMLWLNPQMFTGPMGRAAGEAPTARFISAWATGPGSGPR